MTKFQKIYCYSTTTLPERHINFHQADRDITKCSSKALKILIVQQKNHIITNGSFFQQGQGGSKLS